EDFAGGTFGFGEIAFGIAEVLQGRLQVKGDRVVDFGADVSRGEELAEGIAARAADDVLVPDVVSAWHFLRKDDAFVWIWAGLGNSRCVEEGVIVGGDGTTGVIPGGDVFELDLKDGALKTIEAGIPSEFVVVIAAAHAVLPEHSGAFGDLIVVGGDHASVACGTEIFGGVEAEGGGVPEIAGEFPLPLGAPGLGGIF